MDSKAEYLLHGGPDSCMGEWTTYLWSHKRSALTSILRLLVDDRRKESKIFCLSSGNCGSKYLVHLLRENSIDRCYHEKDLDLDRTGVRYYLTGEYEWAVKRLLLLTRNQVYFESSNRLFSLAPLLKDVFPNSKFIHLHRDGVASVRSGVNKTLWPDVMQHATRLRYASRLAGDPSLDPFERTCHYWANINERIFEDLNGMEDQDVLNLKFEDLIEGKLDELESFLGRALSTHVIEPVNTKDDLKDESVEVIGDFGDWPEGWRRAFVDICGPIQRRLGYEVPVFETNSIAE